MTDIPTVKRCPKCGETKSVDGFHRNRSQHDWLDSQCKDCRRDYNRTYRKAHREEQRAYDRAYNEEHREERRAYSRERHALLGNQTEERWQEITVKHATRKGEPWSEAEDAYLAASTDRIVDDALALKRAYLSTQVHISHLRKRGVILARDAN